MTTDPLTSLLRADAQRTDAARELTSAMSALVDAASSYRTAWRRATSLGWARTDLVRAGLVDPQRLPRNLARATPQPSAMQDAGTDEN
ncbi:hypothetical protein [Actinomyces urogenitalis]|uniref:hypothetical protein n=1 Tax=Actinomyces urogenitalis TaxID=103621 RepID=UPI00242DECD0|nr:hypothetical protein [Actinomyces urogenitalis]MCI7456332.1 hypothetical protein [Actinomyces urogenitalis]